MNKRAEIICSYFKINNKDDEFKISLTNNGFNITHNNKTIFYYGDISYNDYMEFFWNLQ
jgi:hypothetical protein